MAILHINSFNHGSTGSIMRELDEMLCQNGIKSYIAVPNSNSNKFVESSDNQILIGNRIDRNIHLSLSRINGKGGMYSHYITKKFIRNIEKLKIKIIHIHNLHNSYINLIELVSYINKNDIKVIWTFHDCWPITGGCTHFTNAECHKWESECERCPINNLYYPKSIMDNTNKMFKMKKKLFNEINNLEIVVPSKWLKNIVNKSFLKNKSVHLINNGIDLNIFKPVASKKFNTKKKIILGVSNIWNEKKGLNKFIELSNMLDENLYQVILVGVSKSQKEKLPSNILGIERIRSKEELASIYSSADVFVNASIEETAGLVTLESLACGTPVIVTNSTAITEFTSKRTSKVIQNGTTEEFHEEIIKYFKEDEKLQEFDCIERAHQFSIDVMKNKYFELYNNLLGEDNV